MKTPHADALKLEVVRLRKEYSYLLEKTPMPPTIPLSDCKDRGVYLVRARNISLSAFRAVDGCFIGIRHKFDSRYLFGENHVECNDFPTAEPLDYIEQLPEGILLESTDNLPLFEYLERLEFRLQAERTIAECKDFPAEIRKLVTAKGLLLLENNDLRVKAKHEKYEALDDFCALLRKVLEQKEGAQQEAKEFLERNE